MTDLSIEYRSPSELHPDPRNARSHPKRQVDQIAASIAAFGFVSPILVDEDRSIIAGHGRLLGAKQLGLSTVPTIELRGLNDEQKRALRLADNKIAQGSSWNTDVLRAELEALSSITLDFDISLTGFSPPEIDIALSTRAGKLEEGTVGQPPAIPVTRPGDIWILGEHRLGCGDCRDAAFLKKMMDGASADAAFLDPPYNVPIAGFAVSAGTHREFAEAVGEMSSEQFVEFLRATLGACTGVSRDGAVHFVAMDWRHLRELLAAADTVYGAILNLCIWNKSNAGMGSLYRSKHELVLVTRVGATQHYNGVELGRHGRHRSNVWDYASVNTFNKSRASELSLHPTVKPVQLVADAIMDVTKRGQFVLDGFTGSGTTLVAATQIGRVFRGVELDPRYVDVAVERWSAMTCREAVLASTGATFREVASEQEAV